MLLVVKKSLLVQMVTCVSYGSSVEDTFPYYKVTRGACLLGTRFALSFEIPFTRSSLHQAPPQGDCLCLALIS